MNISSAIRKKSLCEICMSEISGSGMKKKYCNGASDLSFSLVTVFKNSHKQTQKIFKQNTLSCA